MKAIMAIRNKNHQKNKSRRNGRLQIQNLKQKRHLRIYKCNELLLQDKKQFAITKLYH